MNILAIKRSVLCDELSFYRLDRVPAGLHLLRASHIGTRFRDTVVTVASGDTLRVDFTLNEIQLSKYPLKRPEQPVLDRLRRAPVVRVYRLVAEKDVPRIQRMRWAATPSGHCGRGPRRGCAQCSGSLPAVAIGPTPARRRWICRS